MLVTERGSFIILLSQFPFTNPNASASPSASLLDLIEFVTKCLKLKENLPIVLFMCLQKTLVPNALLSSKMVSQK